MIGAHITSSIHPGRSTESAITLDQEVWLLGYNTATSCCIHKKITYIYLYDYNEAMEA